MFTAYIKYISLLLISGLILTFYGATKPAISAGAEAKVVQAIKANTQYASFSLYNDVILPLFPALNPTKMSLVSPAL